MNMKIDATDQSFEDEVIKKSETVPVVVDVWAPWCMPCNMLGPVLEGVAEKNEGKFVLVKINVDENPTTSAKYEVRSIPLVKLFKSGKEVDEFVGALPESEVEKWLEKNM